MFKFACIFAVLAVASAGLVPLSIPAAPIVTSRSSQVIARNHNTLAAAPLIAPAPITYAAGPAPITYAAGPAPIAFGAHAAPLSYAAYNVAPSYAYAPAAGPLLYK